MIFGHSELYGVGDEHKMVEHMPLVMIQPHHFDSVLSIAMSMQNELSQLMVLFFK